jgi:hypothetical protein
LKFKNPFWTQLKKIRNWIASIEKSVGDFICIASFVKIGLGIQELIKGRQRLHNPYFHFKKIKVKRTVSRRLH